jgi:DMSO/TMAO reductase YedYZ heme-binding membrane subunit
MSAAPAAAPRTPRDRSWTPRLCALALVLGVSAILVGLASAAPPDHPWQVAARYTARLAFLIFLFPYTASSWHRLAPSAASRFVMRRRRSFGLAFATAHTVHFSALTTYQVAVREWPDGVTLIVGGGAFLVMWAMAATSNDAAVRALGPRWRQLHKLGIHWLWFVFAFSYAGRVAEGKLLFVPLLAAALGGLALRLVVWRRARARRRAAPAREAA